MASQHDQELPAHQIGNAFIQKYYNTFLQTPSALYKFYKENSSVTRSEYSKESGQVITGIKNIQEKLNSFDAQNSKVKLLAMDVQKSMDGSVLVIVHGTLSIHPHTANRSFTQSFILASQQPTGYYVLNDIFRYLSDTDESSNTVPVSGSKPVAAEPAAASTATPTSTTSAPKANGVAHRAEEQLSEVDSTAATIGTGSVIEDSVTATHPTVSSASGSVSGQDEEEERESADELPKPALQTEQPKQEPSKPQKQAHQQQQRPKHNKSKQQQQEQQQQQQQQEDTKPPSSWAHAVGGTTYAPPPASEQASPDSKKGGKREKDQSFKKRKPATAPLVPAATADAAAPAPVSPISADGAPSKQGRYVNSVRVSKLDPATTDDELQQTFSQYGTIVYLNNKASSKDAFAFVFYDTRESVEKVLKLDGQLSIHGVTVNISRKKSRAENTTTASAQGNGEHTGPFRQHRGDRFRDDGFRKIGNKEFKSVDRLGDSNGFKDIKHGRGGRPPYGHHHGRGAKRTYIREESSQPQPTTPQQTKPLAEQ